MNVPLGTTHYEVITESEKRFYKLGENTRAEFWDGRWKETVVFHPERLTPYTPNKCLVHGCGNTSDQGQFVGEICSPCYEFITTGEGRHSSVYRNATKELQEKCDHLHKRSTELIEECRGLHRLKHKQSQLVEWLIDRLGEHRSNLIGELERDVILKQELLETLGSE